MTQEERRLYLIKYLLNENEKYGDIEISSDKDAQKKLLRALFNIRKPKSASDEFIKIQDEYLKAEINEKGITDYKTLKPIENGIYLWQGDITTLKCDAIVNAANSQLLGCFYPNHACIDNAIHTFAGIELRLECDKIMKAQIFSEKTGGAKITPAYNLPCKYVIHTVGPIVDFKLTKRNCEMLYSCYNSCLRLAEENGISNIAFCCISTGEFRFPNVKAAEIAIKAVKAYRAEANSKIEVIFNVFKDRDREIYRELLTKN